MNTDEILKFCGKITEMHWIDGHRFPTNLQVIESAGKFFQDNKCEIFIHATPRQLEDVHRKWIREEHDQFVTALKNQSYAPIEKKYFWNEPKSLLNHFKIIKEFEC